VWLKFGRPEEGPEAASSRVKPDLADNQNAAKVYHLTMSQPRMIAAMTRNACYSDPACTGKSAGYRCPRTNLRCPGLEKKAPESKPMKRRKSRAKIADGSFSM
jgi:hypothetical protein